MIRLPSCCVVILASGWPTLTWSPTATSSATTPSTGAAIACSIFMASTVTTTAPASTGWPSCTPTATTEPGIGLCQLGIAAVFVVRAHRRLPYLLDHRGAPAARQPDLPVGRGHQVLGAQPVQRDDQPITVERCRKQPRLAVFDARGGRARCAGEVDVVGALARMQPERRRRPLPQPPARRHLPQVADRNGPAAQPLVGRRGDQLVVAVLRRGVVGCSAVQQSGVEPAGRNVGIGEQEAQEADVGGDAEHRGVGQRAVERAQRGRPVRPRR